MKVKDLRIGDYFKFQHIEGFISEFKSNKLVILECGNIFVTCEYEDLKPIELTEEWLLKMGFEKKYQNDYIIKFEKEDPEFPEYFEIRCRFHAYICDGIFIDIKYVHQLQNLYHALTGEELTIKD